MKIKSSNVRTGKISEIEINDPFWKKIVNDQSILRELEREPKTWSELWKLLRERIKSKRTLAKHLKELEKAKRIKKVISPDGKVRYKSMKSYWKRFWEQKFLARELTDYQQKEKFAMPLYLEELNKEYLTFQERWVLFNYSLYFILHFIAKAIVESGMNPKEIPINETRELAITSADGFARVMTKNFLWLLENAKDETFEPISDFLAHPNNLFENLKGVGKQYEELSHELWGNKA